MYNNTYKVYYPQAVVVGKPVETREVAGALAMVSTVSRADISAVLGNLAEVLHGFMKNGKSVHIEGLGFFRYKLSSTGVADAGSFDFDAQLNAVRVQFTPEKSKATSGSYTRELADSSTIKWIELPGDAAEA